MYYFTKIAALVASVAVFVNVHDYTAQAQDTSLAPEDSFASENAVLDTSILFAIGAREARQELRGAFGWPTFQEGLVDGVYFRFDPDGYARFAPSPRLDTDVFEVICRPRTLVCMGRKDNLQITLNSRGQVQLEIANITENDQFVLADGISELPLPPSILQPLEPRFELLLASGGEMLVRRNDNNVYRVSLAGFGAVVPYLRWVAAQQDYTVLPRGWPVPNASVGHDSPGLTQTTAWQSPMPQPHVVTQSQAQPAPQSSSQATPVPQAFAETSADHAASVDSQMGQDVAEVRGELNVLRELLLDRQMFSADTPQTQAQPQATQQHNLQTQKTTSPDQLETRINELLEMTAHLQNQLDALQNNRMQDVKPNLHMTSEMLKLKAPSSQPNTMQTPHQARNISDIARHLEYLMTEVGLAPDVALMVVQQAENTRKNSTNLTNVEQDRIINDILLDLRSQIPNDSKGRKAASSTPNSQYRLLADYFQSAQYSK